MRKLIFSFIVGVLLGIGFWFGTAWKTFLTTAVVSSNQPLHYILKPGSSIRTLASDLQDKSVLDNTNFFILLAYLKNTTQKLKAGEYLFLPGTTPGQLLDQIVAGKVILHRFVFIEGWTFKQLLNAINNDPHLIHTFYGLNSIAVVDKLDLPLRNPEGLFLPATYYFTLGTTDVGLLQTAYQKMADALAKLWQQRANNLPYQTPYEALIAASMIEKETAQARERPVIAGVLVRRLKSNMLLQIDSTLIYGLGENYPGKLNRTALAQDTLYNTYLHHGLPPTPIAMPGLASIQAALHPDKTTLLYFVAKGDGTHQFSTTLQAQNQAVTRFQIKTNFPKIGKRLYTHLCAHPWYLSRKLQNLFIRCQIA